MSTQFPVLIADIGGTFTRLALLDGADQAPHLVEKFKTADYENPQSAFATVLAKTKTQKPRTALLAVAAPVGQTPVHLTNAAWWIDPKVIGETLGLDQVTLINDFPPIAAVLPHLDTDNPQDVIALGPPCQGNDGPMLVLGPGTGLGAAVLRKISTHQLIEPTEAGHIEFGASLDDELALWPHLERLEQRHTAESILCGAGIERLYQALARKHGKQDPKTDIVTITQAALAHEPDATACLSLYARLLGRFAGDLALVFGATGGVYIAGGIAPRIIPLLQTGTFRSGFENKAPFAAMIKAIPTYIVTRPDPALHGLAQLASHPDRYWLNSQIWTHG
jgi:glucokinase